MAVRTRRDVWKLAQWDDVLVWYSKAIREMQTRPIAEPTSWRYQAAVHEYYRDDDPNADPSDKLPSSADQTKFWTQCQHHSWFFLPWHRWYLYYFEEIVAATVVKLGGPKDWSLPYWNYSETASNANVVRLPPAFHEPNLPDGSRNALFVDERDRGNDGGIVGRPRDIDLACLKEPKYTADPKGGSGGFGGPKTKFNHGAGSVVGALEVTPHGSMHVRVGGFMSSFTTAGLDPIFWLHHCNIDRLWAVWRKRDSHHVDPVDPQWLTMSFDFHDAAGKAVSSKVADVVDTTALGFQYEDLSDPLRGAFVAPPAPVRRMAVAEEPPRIPEMVGATEQPIRLAGQPTTARVAVNAPTGPARAALAADAKPRRVFLNLENITGKGSPKGYSVYVNVPDGQTPQQREDLFAGVLPMFGVTEATRESEKHSGEGLHYTLDITDLVERLKAQNAWDPSKLHVTFVPDDEPPRKRMAAAAAPEPQFQVGRVSVYFA
jgi:tyrosinase